MGRSPVESTPRAGNGPVPPARRAQERQAYDLRQDGAKAGDLGQPDGSIEPGLRQRAHLLIPLALRTRLESGRTQDLVADLAHEEYEGRNVLSIVARDEYDGLEEVTYYDQRVFRRHRSTSVEEPDGDGN